MDLVSVSLLALFGGAAAGGLLGFLVGRFSRFEAGLACGLLVFGAVAMTFAVRCYLEYRDFAYAGPNAAWGEVIAIEDQPANASGSVTTPVPVVRFTGPDNATHEIRGPSASGAQVGSHVNVIVDPLDPQRSRIGQIGELRGAAIALMLFGTFPLTFAVWLLSTTLLSADARAATRPSRTGRAAQQDARSVPDPVPSRTGRIALGLLGGGLVCAILWIGFAPGDLQTHFVQGFGAIAAVCTGYTIWGVASRGVSAAWSAGMLVLAVNFGVWALALHLLR